MTPEQQRAQANLEGLRADLEAHKAARAQHLAAVEHENTIIAQRHIDITNAEEHEKVVSRPVYDRSQGVARRVSHVSRHYITIRWDLGRTQEFRRSDGKPKCSHSRGERIDVARAVGLYNEYLAERYPNCNLTCP